jgi:hypothetical protein
MATKKRPPLKTPSTDSIERIKIERLEKMVPMCLGKLCELVKLKQDIGELKPDASVNFQGITVINGAKYLTKVTGFEISLMPDEKIEERTTTTQADPSKNKELPADTVARLLEEGKGEKKE